MAVDRRLRIAMSQVAGLGPAFAGKADTEDLEAYVPYTAVDELHMRGTLAARPAATAVVPGTLYSITDYRHEVQRSNGTDWERWAPRRHVAIFPYTFSNVTTAPPTGSQIRLDAASPYTAVSKLWVRYVGRDGRDYWRGLATQAGVAVVIQDEGDHTIWAEFLLTANAIDVGTYFEWSIAYSTGSGAAFSNNQTVLLLKL